MILKIYQKITEFLQIEHLIDRLRKKEIFRNFNGNLGFFPLQISFLQVLKIQEDERKNKEAY